MYDTKTPQELQDMRQNIRRNLQALEVCWSCQRVSECEAYVIDNAAPVWLCAPCSQQMPPQWGNESATHLVWPLAV